MRHLSLFARTVVQELSVLTFRSHENICMFSQGE